MLKLPKPWMRMACPLCGEWMEGSFRGIDADAWSALMLEYGNHVIAKHQQEAVQALKAA